MEQNVLIVDEFSLTAEADRSFLNKEGYRAISIQNILDVPTLLSEIPLEAIIIDYNPKKIQDLNKILSKIRKLKHHPKIIMSINQFTSKERIKINEDFIEGFIYKPIQKNRYLDQIKRALTTPLKKEAQGTSKCISLLIHYNKEEIKAETLDLSIAGIYLKKSKKSLPLNTYLEIEIALQKNKLRIGGHVVLETEDGYGIRFSDLGFQNEINQIKEFIVNQGIVSKIYPFYL